MAQSPIGEIQTGVYELDSRGWDVSKAYMHPDTEGKLAVDLSYSATAANEGTVKKLMGMDVIKDGGLPVGRVVLVSGGAIRNDALLYPSGIEVVDIEW